MSTPSQPTQSILRQIIVGYQTTQMIYVALKLGVIDLLANESRTSPDLAAKTNSHPESLYRLLRGMCSIGILAEEAGRRFRLSPMGELLQSDEPCSLSSYALSYGEPWWWAAYGDLLRTVQTGETAFDRVHGMSFFEFLRNNAVAGKRFHANMTTMTQRQITWILETYDFSNSETVVDVGGGHGALLAAILKAHPNSRGVLLDQSDVLDGARRYLTDIGVLSRCQLVAQSFFDGIPTGGDTYILKDVIHDWPADLALCILRNCRSAMADTSTLLILERVLPDDATPTDAALVDITMMVLTGGAERTAEEYYSLCDAAGLQVRSLRNGSDGDIIEASPTSD